MALFEWNEDLATGIETIDNQHKKLISIINELHESMKQGKGKEIINRVLEELLSYTKYHFGTEEELFKKYNYLESSAHIKAHTEFTNKINKYIDGAKNSIAPTVSVFNYLVDWLRNHILLVDKKYVPLFKEMGVK